MGSIRYPPYNNANLGLFRALLKNRKVPELDWIAYPFTFAAGVVEAGARGVVGGGAAEKGGVGVDDGVGGRGLIGELNGPFAAAPCTVGGALKLTCWGLEVRTEAAPCFCPCPFPEAFLFIALTHGWST